MTKTPARAAVLLLLGLLAACHSDRPAGQSAAPAAGVLRAEPAQPRGKPALIIQGTPVELDQLTPQLAEAAGAVVLEELILDRALSKAVAEENLHVGTAEVEAERQSLLRSLQAEANLTAGQAELSLESLRRQRGLGPVRFESLLLRNARLRALARPGIDLTNEEIDRGVAIEFGPRYRARVILTDDARKAAEARGRIMNALPPEGTAGPDSQVQLEIASAVFARVAVAASLHITAGGGGLVTELSPSDAQFPALVRDALPTLVVGRPSAVYATPEGYWIVLIEKAIEGAAPTDADRDTTRRRLLARKERMEMDRIGRQLMNAAGLTVLDASLRWSWDARLRG